MNVAKVLIPSWRWILCALLVGVAVAAAVPAYGAISGKRWTIPSANLYSMSLDGAGTMWAKGYQNSVYSLQPANDTLTTWTHANSAILGPNHYGSAVAQPSSNFVWVTAQNLDHVNRLDTSNGQLLSWAFPASTSCSAYTKNLAVDSTGTAWFGKNDSKLASLDPATNTLKEWPMPTAGAYCPEVSFSEGSGASQKIWFCEPTLDKIGFLAPSTGSVTEWTIPGNPAAFTNCNQPVGGKIWFSHTTTQVRRLDTVANEVTTWACQMGCTAVYGISHESAGKVWFADASDLISFDPVAEEFIEYTGLGCAAQFPFIDGSGNIWTSQGGGGLVCRFPPP